MRKFKILIVYLFFLMSVSGEELNMNLKLQSAMDYYFTDLIPKCYQGQEDFSEEMNLCCYHGFDMQGNGFSFFDDTDDIVFDFYYLINHDRQDCQGMLITDYEENGIVYEYWGVKMWDIGYPYNYSYFYLTKANSKQDKREIIQVSKIYQDSYKLESGTIVDLSFRNLNTLYTSRPEEKLESFKGTKYEGKIVKWKGKEPYLRNMNLFEKIYYKHLKKSER